MSNILIIEDNDTMREGLIQVLSKVGHYVQGVTSGPEGVVVFKREHIDVVLSDLKMKGMDGLQVLDELKRLDPDAVFVMMTAYGTIELAVEAMRRGAFDFITKPFSPDVLRVKVEKALGVRRMTYEHSRLQHFQEYVRENERDAAGFSAIIGKSKKVVEILETVRKVAAMDSSVIITGESGTGKELVARAIHYNSPRKDGPFIKVNCGALAEGVLESELFGHERGAFTGAVKRKMGRFELADHGTLFLDEIGDFSPAIQLKLLRVLQEREFERVGGTQTLQIDVRLISATNKDLRAEIDRGTFRSDLYYRLHIVPIVMPPLRERREDIPMLAEHFLQKHRAGGRKTVSGFSPEALEALKAYSWPGNIRELENTVEQAYVLTDGEIIEQKDLPLCLAQREATDMIEYLTSGRSLPEVLEKVERDMIEHAFKKAHGVKAETARLLGVKPSALYYKLEKYGIL